MNKKVNTALFIIISTFANIMIMSLIHIVTYVLVLKISSIILGDYALGLLNTALAIIIPFSAIAFGIIIYKKLIKILSNKIDMKKYFCI